MRRLDDFLIDRVFQPAADALAAWMSCYGIAAFLLTGFGLEHLAIYVYHEQYVWICVAAAWLVPLCRRAYTLDAQPPRNVMPIERVSRISARMMDLIMFPMFTTAACVIPDITEKIDLIGWLMIGPAEYFLACRKHPPQPLRAANYVNAGA